MNVRLGLGRFTVFMPLPTDSVCKGLVLGLSIDRVCSFVQTDPVTMISHKWLE